jgi:hypothetical protein
MYGREEQSSALEEVGMNRFNRVTLVVFLPSLIALCGCQGLVPHDTQSILFSHFHRSEIIGIVAGFGTTFALCRT